MNWTIVYLSDSIDNNTYAWFLTIEYNGLISTLLPVVLTRPASTFLPCGAHSSSIYFAPQSAYGTIAYTASHSVDGMSD